MEDAKNQLADKLKTSNNILVTVSRDPSVDQLAACIGLTLLLNKQGKHAAAVFSGNVPSTLEFLQPEETLEKTTDSLRDFIISLDKSKADKLRYKVEDNVVRIFITPYRTSISDADLEFTQGDFNVDLVVALGVHLQEDLDEAITAHGRILHDATLASITTSAEAGLGTINWQDQQASSLCELVTELAEKLDSKLLDNQIATALLTGIVAETDRFSNDKTSSETMAASAALMSAGANQQLVASKLQEGLDISAPIRSQAAADDQSEGESPAPPGDGVIEINHNDGDEETQPPFELPTPEMGPEEADNESPEPPEPADEAANEPGDEPTSNITSGSRLVTEPPTLGGMLTANSQIERLDPTTDPLSLPSNLQPQMFDRKASSTLPSTPSAPDSTAAPQTETEAVPMPDAGFTPPPPAWEPPPAPIPATDFQPQSAPIDSPQVPDAPAPSDQASDEPSAEAAARTLADIEASIKDPHTDVEQPPAATEPETEPETQSATEPAPDNIDAMRDEVSRALNDSTAGTAPPEPIQALNAQPLGNDLHPTSESNPASTGTQTNTIAIPPLEISEDGVLTEKPLTISPTIPPPEPATSTTSPSDNPQVIDATAPPPFPPPLPFQFGTPPPNNH